VWCCMQISSIHMFFHTYVYKLAFYIEIGHFLEKS
jgi:hypothetical protein